MTGCFRKSIIVLYISSNSFFIKRKKKLRARKKVKVDMKQGLNLRPKFIRTTEQPNNNNYFGARKQERKVQRRTVWIWDPNALHNNTYENQEGTSKQKNKKGKKRKEKTRNHEAYMTIWISSPWILSFYFSPIHILVTRLKHKGNGISHLTEITLDEKDKAYITMFANPTDEPRWLQIDKPNNDEIPFVHRTLMMNL